MAAGPIGTQNNHISMFFSTELCDPKVAYYRGFLSTEVLAARVVVAWPVRRNRNEGEAEGRWENMGKKKEEASLKR
jgi:hypothetical protein